MYTVPHSLLRAKSGEPVKITFTISDQNGNPVTVTGAAATYKIARRLGLPALLTKTQSDGITLSGSTAIVEFDTGGLVENNEALLGDFVAQLKIIRNGDALVVAEGPLQVEPVI